ncbi:hypothetical protein AMECASPLE_013763 [Ameca splendens]|uniref:Uncharacterized protein n=1 Tax=Ameca splendens TaxID=208324 RepID=A0ABV1AAD0_9TELE
MVVEEYKNKIELLVGTGMLKINNLKRTDSGQYIVESYDPNGRRKDIYFSLQVKENIFLILNSVRFAVVVLLTAVLFCCMCSKFNLCGDSGGNQANDENLFKMYQTAQRE